MSLYATDILGNESINYKHFLSSQGRAKGVPDELIFSCADKCYCYCPAGCKTCCRCGALPPGLSEGEDEAEKMAFQSESKVPVVRMSPNFLLTLPPNGMIAMAQLSGCNCHILLLQQLNLNYGKLIIIQ